MTSIPEALSDADLVERVRLGERALFEPLVRRYNQRLYRVARSILRDDHEAEDAVQEAYVSAFLKLHTFEGRSSFATWLTRIAVREALTRKRRQRPDLTDIPEAKMTDPGPTPEVLAADRELAQRIETEIDQLPETFRTVFMLRLVQELSTAETAASLEILEQTVKTRLHRAKVLLRDRLGDVPDRGMQAAHAFDGARCDRLTRAVMAHILETP